MRPFVRLALIALTFHAGQVAAQQEVAFAERGPQFLLAANGSPTRIEASRIPILRQRISLDLRDVSMHDAITAISRQSGLQLMFSEKILSRDRAVTLRAEAITVAAALTEVLLDAEVDVLFSRSGNAALVRRSATAAPAQVGAVTGHVTDSISREGVGGATITIEGTRLSATTAADGGYTIRGVPAGNRSLTARRLGFVRQSRAVTVADNEATTVNFVLVRAPTTLSEVVTTATGDQRRVELGHVVGRINADSLVKEAPVSSLSDVLMGRVPGLQVFQSQGTVGGEVKLQVRGRNSVLLGTEPIVIVDGVRYATNAITPAGFGPVGERTSPLNDLNPNDIESIEVVKGPSAATMYGTDAANGVIVVTTKNGRPGPARWSAYAKTGRTSIPTGGYPDKYKAFGTRPSGQPASACALMQLATGFCARQDSIVVVPNPLNDPALTMFGAQPRQETGLSVAGGTQGVRYYFAAGVEDAVGPVVMPRAVAEFLEEQRGSGIPEDWRNPNTRTNLNLRTNVTVHLGKAGELSVRAGYIRDATRSLALTNPFAVGVSQGTPTHPYGTQWDPEDVFTGISTERTDRFVGGALAHWRLAPWLLSRATVGLDLGIRHRAGLQRRGDAPNSFVQTVRQGAVSDDRARMATMTTELSATATVRRGRISSRTSMGGQHVRALTDVLASSGWNLPPGGSSVPEAATRRTTQSYIETLTLGGYLEETVGLNDRLFLTGALRADGASTFGRNYNAVVYPKAGASWLVSDEPFLPRVPGINELRLRYAYGASGQQPQPAWALPRYALTQGFLNDAPGTVMSLTSGGNPDVRPERVREHEFGFDAAGLGNRMRLGLTWYRRRTTDQIVTTPLAAGYGSIFTNLGLTTQRGFEAELTANVVDIRWLSWDVVARHSLHRTKLLDLGGASESRSVYGTGYAEGYPLGARFLPELIYDDANSDGIIEASELQSPFFCDFLTCEWNYAGESAPPVSQTLTSVLGLFDRRVRISALLERRAGFTQINGLKTRQCAEMSGCLPLLEAGTPLPKQAEALAAGTSFSGYPFLESGDYTRLREVIVALDLPPVLVRFVRLRSATASLSGRNLALWTDFSGADPESSGIPSAAYFNVIGGIPQGRTWAIRVDVGF